MEIFEAFFLDGVVNHPKITLTVFGVGLTVMVIYHPRITLTVFGVGMAVMAIYSYMVP